MAIDYMNDIVSNLFASEVGNDTAYEAPGDFGLPDSFGDPTDGQKRILTLVEIIRAYFDAVQTTEEAKLLFVIMGRMLARRRYFSDATLLQYDCLHYLSRSGGVNSKFNWTVITDERGDRLLTEDGRPLIGETAV